MSSTTTLTPSPAAPSSQGQGDQPSSQGQGDLPVVQGLEDSVPGVTQGSLNSLSAESAPAPATLLDSEPPCQPSPSLAASGQSHQQAGSGQEGDGAKSPSPKRSGKKKKKTRGLSAYTARSSFKLFSIATNACTWMLAKQGERRIKKVIKGIHLLQFAQHIHLLFWAKDHFHLNKRPDSLISR